MNVYRRECSVRAVRCDHRATDDEVFERLQEATDGLDRSWNRLRRARKVAIKLNQDFPVSHMYAGRRRELVSDAVARAVFRLLRKRTDAELVCVDASYMKLYQESDPSKTTQIAAVLKEYDIRYVDCTEPPFIERVLADGAMFGRYHFHAELLEADERVSVAKMKNHGFMGVTGTLKNLFGLMPGEFRPRHYFHHLVRMPYMLGDIGRILDPALNIVDALVAQPGREWRPESAEGVVVDALIAGDHPVATDACMAHLMGHDPEADWLTDPFLRDRNALEAAREHGFGTNRIREIDFRTDLEPKPPGVFSCESVDPVDTIVDWRRTMCEQALSYRDHQDRFDEYRNQFVMIQRGEVKWSSPSGSVNTSRRTIAGDTPRESLFLKFVDPDETEAERFTVYERALRDIEERRC